MAAAFMGFRRIAALESGTFAAPRETFDLRPLVRQSLGPLQAKAGAGPMLRWRVDPRLPGRLRGHAQAFGRILSGLADYGVEAAGAAGARIAIDGEVRDGRKILLQIRVDGLATKPDPAAAPAEVPLTLKLVRRLVSLAGGEFAGERLANHRTPPGVRPARSPR